MTIADLPEKTRRHLELEYSFNTSPDDKTKSALAQLTGLAIEEVSEWFETEWQKGQPYLSTVKSRHVEDQGRLHEPTTAHRGDRQRPGTLEFEEFSPEVREKDQDTWSLIDKSLDSGYGNEEVRPHHSTSMPEDPAEPYIGPLVSTRVRDYPAQLLDRMFKGESQARQNSIPNCTAASVTSQSIISKSSIDSVAAAKVNRSSDGITTRCESSLPGVSVFSLSEGREVKKLSRRRKYNEVERRNVAETRRRGACERCRVLRVKVSEPCFFIKMLEISHALVVCTRFFNGPRILQQDPFDGLDGLLRIL
jgi:hypothetical protein